jgi:protein ImuA
MGMVRKADIIARLQKDILLLQGFKPAGIEGNDAGLNAIKYVFPNGAFPLAAIHEFLTNHAEDTAASSGFMSGIVASLMKTGAPCVWVSSSKHIFPPALKTFGIEPAKIIFIQTKKPKEILWTVEEALKCDSLSSVVGEISEISFTESRRLQLAVEQTKVTGFLLRHRPKNLSTACVTRWRITPVHSSRNVALSAVYHNEKGVNGEMEMPGLGFPRWNVELLKVRNGKTGTWQMEWREGKFRLIHQPVFAVHEPERKVG